MGDLTLFGYRWSVYTRVVRMLLAEKGIAPSYVEVDPFAERADPVLRKVSPFDRVPVLRHGDFTLYETAAITCYLDEVFPDPAFRPAEARAAARMRQVIGIVDSDAYPVLVRMVYAEGVFRPADGERCDTVVLADGLARAPRVLSALEAIAAEGMQLAPGTVSLADFHLAPMIAAFAALPDGADMLAGYPALAAWFEDAAARPGFVATRPGLRLP